MDVEARSTMPSLELASSGLRVACPISFAGPFLFIAGINGTQPGQPVPGTPRYVVSSDFEPKPKVTVLSQPSCCVSSWPSWPMVLLTS
jgi:hypothetical protein